eukprot:6183898-Pleurochrysis_carterae.AAC.9
MIVSTQGHGLAPSCRQLGCLQPTRRCMLSFVYALAQVVSRYCAIVESAPYEGTRIHDESDLNQGVAKSASVPYACFVCARVLLQEAMLAAHQTGRGVIREFESVEEAEEMRAKLASADLLVEVMRV